MNNIINKFFKMYLAYLCKDAAKIIKSSLTHNMVQNSGYGLN